MSGHSKWKTIQHKKGAQDAKRGKIFSKFSKELMIVARQGGGSLDTNPTLRNLVARARASSMPTDNIERAIKKGTGELEGGTIDEVTYEAFAQGGVAMVVQVLTDNKNRAAAEIRHIFNRHGSSFASQGSVMRSFKRKGQILVDSAGVAEDKLMDIVLEAGAEDMTQDDGPFEILTEPGNFQKVLEALEKAGIKTVSAEVTLIPDNYVPIKDRTVASAVMRFVSEMEEHDDVQNVYTNMDVSDDVLKALEQDERK